MSNIVLVAETGSDIPVDVAKKYGIHLVPMHVSFGDTTHDDGTFPIQKIYDYYKETDHIPKTSGSTPADFEKVFDEIHTTWPEKQILYLAYSAVTTTSYQCGLLAAAGRDYVTSIDTKHVSVGQGSIVIRLAQVLDADPDLPLEAAVELANQFCLSTRMCFLPDDLSYLRAGGRVSNVAYLGSRLLHIHPTIEIRDGLLIATKKRRGRLVKIAPQLIREYADTEKLSKERLYLLWSKGLSENVKKAAENEAKQCGFQKVIWMQTGCVITIHGGPGAFGIVGYSDEENDWNEFAQD